MFKRTADDEEWHKTMEERDMVGHPPNVEWFCDTHLDRAEKLASMTLRDAMASW